MKIDIINPDEVYVIGAAGFWLKHWSRTDQDRDRRVFRTIARKLSDRIEQEKRKQRLMFLRQRAN